MDEQAKLCGWIGLWREQLEYICSPEIRSCYSGADLCRLHEFGQLVFLFKWSGYLACCYLLQKLFIHHHVWPRSFLLSCFLFPLQKRCAQAFCGKTKAAFYLLFIVRIDSRILVLLVSITFLTLHIVITLANYIVSRTIEFDTRAHMF